MSLSLNLPDLTNYTTSDKLKISLDTFIKFINPTSEYLDTNYITLDFTTLNIVIPTKLRNDPVVIPIIFKLTDTDSHINIAFINYKKRIVELYEPHGIRFHSEFKYDFQHHIGIALSHILKFRFTIYNIHNSCPIGFQTKQYRYIASTVSTEIETGSCLAWSSLLIFVKSKNPEVSFKDIIKYFDNFSTPDLDSYIKKFISYILDTTQKIQNKQLYQYSVGIKLSNTELKNLKIDIERDILTFLENSKYNTDFYGLNFQDTRVDFIKYSQYPFFPTLFFKTINKFYNNNK